MKLTAQRVVVLGAIAVLAACSGSSGGNGGGSSGSSSGGDGGGSSSGGHDGGGSSSGAEGGGSSSGAEAGTFPTVKITAPTAGSTANVTKTSTEEDVSVTFTLTNFMLMAPGGCGSVSNSCGHIHVYVDDNTCTPSGSPYNNAIASGTSGNAILSNCPTATDPINGSHKVRLELHDDQHGAILDASGQQVQDSVQFTATGG
jgi:hypothetical protein